jgi:hypothetical protein
VIGATLTGAVAVLVALVTNGPVSALLVLAVMIAVQQLEGHVLQPLIMGRAVSLHPLAVILAIATGIVVTGIVGGLVAVPMLAVANTAVRYLAAHPTGEPTADRTPPGTEPTDEDQAQAERAVDEAAERADPRRAPTDRQFRETSSPCAAGRRSGNNDQVRHEQRRLVVPDLDTRLSGDPQRTRSSVTAPAHDPRRSRPGGPLGVDRGPKQELRSRRWLLQLGELVYGGLVVFEQLRGSADKQRIRRADDVGVLVVVVEFAEQVADGSDPGAFLVVAFDERPRRVGGVAVEEHGLLGLGGSRPTGRVRPGRWGRVSIAVPGRPGG